MVPLLVEGVAGSGQWAESQAALRGVLTVEAVDDESIGFDMSCPG